MLNKLGSSFETRQKVLTFAPTIAEIAQSVEHQLPKLRAAGSNPVFRSRKPADDENHPFFLYPYGTDASSLAEGAGWIQKRRCASTSGFLESAPPARREGMAEPQSRGGGEGMHRPQGEHNPAEAGRECYGSGILRTLYTLFNKLKIVQLPFSTK